MLTSIDTDTTLPSIIAAGAGRQTAQELVLTVLFHPDTSRIGQRAVVTKHLATKPWILGRRSPVFSFSGESNSIALEDPHVSRRALQFLFDGKQLTIQRFDSTSRCRVGRSELYDSVLLEQDQLVAGVPIMLGHSIVLMLRLADHSKTPARACGLHEQLIGSGVAMVQLREQVAIAAASGLDVLIRGETGTGKELVATAIHAGSKRTSRPLVSVNMAAIPSDLAAAALFGSARGAFTGADKASAGYFDQAQGGSLFLDEIGDAAVAVQPQLLRALQQREIQSVGGPIRSVDVRVISATDAELDGESCDFKAALRHRLGAIEILIPPLRERPEDIGELLRHFLLASAAGVGRTNLLPDHQSPAPLVAAWAALFYNFACYRWPGNVRELGNFAQQVVLAGGKTPVLTEAVLTAFAVDAERTHPTVRRSPLRRMQDIDDEGFASAMDACGCEVKRVARELGVSRAAVYRRIEGSSSYRLVSEIPPDELQSMLTAHAGDSDAAARELRVSAASLRSRLRKLQTGT